MPEEISADIPNWETIEEKTKQSTFWITYEFVGKQYKTNEKLWKTDFQQVEPGIGKCNFDNIQILKLKPSKELRDQLRNGLVLKLWERKPIITKIGTEPDIKPQVTLLDNNTKVKTEQNLIGILKIELNSWLTDRKLWKNELFGKFRLYAPNLLTRPEYMHPNHYLTQSFTEKEIKFLDEVKERAIQADLKKQATLQEENTQKVPAKGKETKKEAKKQPPKKTGKDAVQASIEIPDIEAPEQPIFTIIEKSFKSGISGYLAERSRAQQEEAKKKADEQKSQAKKKEETEEQKEKEKNDKKEQILKRMEKYVEVLLGGKMQVILKITLNGLEIKKQEEEKKEEKKETKKDGKAVKGKETKKEVKKK